MLPAFKTGLAGMLGPGTQWLPWVGLDDAICAFYAALMDDRVSGVLNVVAPTPVTNRQFTRTLGRVLHRPTALTVPTFVLKAAGQMGREMLLSSQRVALRKLNAAGFRFRDPELESMLHRVMGVG
jgi:NAD dependent epimerase/dehydratase family enzyme